MKFNCDRFPRWIDHRILVREERARTWRRKFAWLPVKVGAGDCRWLEVVETRKFNTYDGYIESVYSRRVTGLAQFGEILIDAVRREYRSVR